MGSSASASSPPSPRSTSPLLTMAMMTMMMMVQGSSCVRFVPWAEAEEGGRLAFVRVEEVPSPICRATVGLTRPAPFVKISAACSRGQILHELFHVLGFRSGLLLTGWRDRGLLEPKLP